MSLLGKQARDKYASIFNVKSEISQEELSVGTESEEIQEGIVEEIIIETYEDHSYGTFYYSVNYTYKC